MIELFVQSRYKVDRKKLKKRVRLFLEKMGISLSDYDFSLAVVGDRKMRELNRKYRQKEGTTPVLAFGMSDSAASRSPKEAARVRLGGKNMFKAASAHHSHLPETTLLGEVVVSYPQALLLAAEENKLVDEKIGELVEHGLAKLLTA